MGRDSRCMRGGPQWRFDCAIRFEDRDEGLRRRRLVQYNGVAFSSKNGRRRGGGVTALFAEALAGSKNSATLGAEKRRRFGLGRRDNYRGHLIGVLASNGFLRNEPAMRKGGGFVGHDWRWCANGMTALFTEALAGGITRTALFTKQRRRLGWDWLSDLGDGPTATATKPLARR